MAIGIGIGINLINGVSVTPWVWNDANTWLFNQANTWNWGT